MRKSLRCVFVVAASCSSCCVTNVDSSDRVVVPSVPAYPDPEVVFVNTERPLLEVWMPEGDAERGRVLARIAVSGFEGVELQEMSDESPGVRPCFRYAGVVYEGIGPEVLQAIREAMYRPIPGPVTAPFGMSPDEHTRYVDGMRGE
ncbi:MAG: hypothetical protein E6Q97_30735 [Desulfurellales bacterium]|nr:MAG: hypothetical protein E6Q97_30735 [Desulfurellales bacterium]